MSYFSQTTLFSLQPDESPLTAIKGFSYTPDFITPELETELLNHIDEQPWNSEWKRRVQQYGSSYGKSRKSQAPIPTWLMPICERLAGEHYFSEVPNQIIVNEYMPGQGIAPHSDYLTTGNIVASLSLGAAIVMDFVSPEEKKLPHLLEARSLFILSDSARYDWKHGIAARKTDKFHGIAFERKRRISCTFRNALSSPERRA